MNTILPRLAVLCLLWLLVPTVRADQLLLIRSPQAFPEAMSSLQASLSKRGYKVARVQNVDIGLTKIGYQTDNYKVVFFGREGEVQRLAAAHPDLIAYLPLNVAIFAEGNETILVASRPTVLGEFFPDSGLKALFAGWEKDLEAVMDEVREGR